MDKLLFFTIFCFSTHIYAESNCKIVLELDLSLIFLGFTAILFFIKITNKLSIYEFDYKKINFIDRKVAGKCNLKLSKISDITIALLALSFLILIKLNRSWECYFKEIIIILKAVLITSILTSFVKYKTKRPRPFLYGNNIDDIDIINPKNNVSFFSGHTANSFASSVAFAIIFSERFNEIWQKLLVWTVVIFISSLIGFMRVKSGKHFYTDVIVGMFVGILVGYFVSYFHNKF